MGWLSEYKPAEKVGCVLWLLVHAEVRIAASTLLLLPARLKIARYANLCYNHIFTCSANIPLVEITQSSNGPGISILAIGPTERAEEGEDRGGLVGKSHLSTCFEVLLLLAILQSPLSQGLLWRGGIPFNCSSKNQAVLGLICFCP